MEERYNTRSPAVKRLMREAQELSEPTDQYYAQPLEDNLFEWHFTVRGPADSDFQNGIYHGRIILPVDYPMKPPSIIWLTPNGRFETNKKICLSISGHHPESWQPSWSIRTALLAIIGFMPTRPGGAIGSLDYTPEERKVLAKKSQDWKCQACGSIDQILLERSTEQPQASQEAKDLAAQIQFQGEKSKGKGECSVTSSNASTLSSATESTKSSSTATTKISENQPKQQPQVIPQSPGFSPWNFPGTMPTMTQGFPPPMTWPGPPSVTPINDGCAPLSMIPRFPYPPSQQPIGTFPMQFYPPGFPLVPSQVLGMFPFPQTFPAPASPQVVANCNTESTTVIPSHQMQVSSNNSSSDSESSNVQTSVVQESSRKNNMRQWGSSPNFVTRVDSSSGASHQSALDIEKDVREKRTTVKTADTADAGEDYSSQDDVALHSSFKDVKDSDIIDKTSSHKDGEEGTEQGQLDLPADRPSDEDNSHSGIPPLDFSEGEQRSSYLERSVSSSVPDLEKQSRHGQKGLRYRQSATAAVPTTEVGEDTGQSADLNNQTGQRIEAASGDTHPRVVRLHQPPRAFAEARLAHRNAVARSTQHRAASQYDGSFFAMLILGIATVVILLNRLVRLVDWSIIL